MTWTKLDDGFWANPKVILVGNAAAGAYARMLSYCGQHLSDGRVPAEAVRFIASKPQIKKLEEHGFIQKNGSGWVIEDYLDYNIPAEQAKAKQKVRRAAGKLGGVASGKARSKR